MRLFRSLKGTHNSFITMKIYKYILKAHAAPFFISFFIVIFVFTFQFIMKYIDNLVGKGLSWWLISQLISLNLAWMVTLAGPMAALVATLMAFGSLSSTNEITVMQSSGISVLKLMIPVLLLSGLLCYGLILFNNDVLPEANHRTKVLMSDIQRTKPMFAIEPGKFTDDISGYNMLVKKTFPASNKLEGIFIINDSDPEKSSILTADSGEIAFSKDYSKIILDLYSGEIHQLNKENFYAGYRRVDFEKHIVSISAQGFGFTKSDQNALSRGDRELSADSMRKIVDKIKVDVIDNEKKTLESAIQLAKNFASINYSVKENELDSVSVIQMKLYIQTLLNRYKSVKSKIISQDRVRDAKEREIDSYWVEIHKKYSIPFACIVFVLIGAPLGVKTKRGGFGVAAGMSLGFFLLYWAFLIGGEKLADRQMLSPFLSMWTANFVLGAIGLYFTLKYSVNIKQYFKRFKK
jgi:lipopolysaccharide export system permease protein